MTVGLIEIVHDILGARDDGKPQAFKRKSEVLKFLDPELQQEVAAFIEECGRIEAWRCDWPYDPSAAVKYREAMEDRLSLLMRTDSLVGRIARVRLAEGARAVAPTGS